MPAHTPGPWRRSGSIVTGPRMALKIAECGGGYGPLSKYPECWAAKTEAEGQANARLIAAAPDLLAALTNLVADFDKSVWTTDPMLVEARAAIAKATGGTE